MNQIELKLEYYRKKANLSQQDLSHLSGVSRTTINQLESGKKNITTTGTLEKLAVALGKKVSDLFC